MKCDYRRAAPYGQRGLDVYYCDRCHSEAIGTSHTTLVLTQYTRRKQRDDGHMTCEQRGRRDGTK